MTSTIKQTIAQIRQDAQDKIDALTKLAQKYLEENEQAKVRKKLVSHIADK